MESFKNENVNEKFAHRVVGGKIPDYLTFDNGLDNPKYNKPASELPMANAYPEEIEIDENGKECVVKSDEVRARWSKTMREFWKEIADESKYGFNTEHPTVEELNEPQHVRVPQFNEAIWMPVPEIEVIQRLNELNLQNPELDESERTPYEGARYSGRVLFGLYEASNTTAQTRGSIFGGVVRAFRDDDKRVKMPTIAEFGRDIAMEEYYAKVLRNASAFSNTHGLKESIRSALIQRDQSGGA